MGDGSESVNAEMMVTRNRKMWMEMINVYKLPPPIIQLQSWTYGIS